MSVFARSAVIQAIYRSFPHSDQIDALDLDTESSAIRFTWRGDTFRVSETGHVEQCISGCLHGSNLALLARRLIQAELIRREMAAPALEADDQARAA